MSDLQINHEYWMHQALKLAESALNKNEVPVGAVLIHNNKIIGEGWNCPISRHDPTAHAEIIALRQGGLRIKNYRLLNTRLYVTLKPCMMCFGAIMHSRIEWLIYGADNEKTGIKWMSPSVLKYLSVKYQLNIINGVLKEECSILLTNFFRICRTQKNNDKKIKCMY